MPAFKPVPPELAARFHECLPASDLVERRKMFGCPCAFVNGNMFTGLHEDRLVLRLPAEDRERVLRSGQCLTFEVMGRTMREYVVLPAPLAREAEEVMGWIAQSFAFGRSLPPKAPRPRAVKVSKPGAGGRPKKSRP